MKIHGLFYQANSVTPIEAQLAKQGDYLWVETDKGESIEVQLDHVMDRLGNVPRKIYFAGGDLFETKHNNAVDEMFGLNTGFLNWLSKAEASWKIVAVSAVACVMLIYSLFVYGLPMFAAGAAWATPEIALTAIDKGSMQSVDRFLLEPSELDDEKKAELQELFDEIVEVSEQKSPMPRLHFRNGGKMGANAFALPGGTIIFTDQIIELAKDEDELAGVIAHEIGHVAGRHGLKQIYRVLGIGFMISVIGGDQGQLIEEVVAQAALLQNLSYSREFEIDADTYSVKVMQKAKRDPTAFVNLLDRIVPPGGGDDGTSWLDTHPSNSDRRKSVEDLIHGSH